MTPNEQRFKISDKVVCIALSLDQDAPLLFIGRVYVIQDLGDGWVEIVGHVENGDGTIHCFRPCYFRHLDEIKAKKAVRELAL